MATAAIIGSGDMTSGARKSGLTSASVVPVWLDPENLRKTEYTVYLHTISRRAFMQPNGIYRNVMVPACPKDKRSFCFMGVQHPVQIPTLNPDDVNGTPLMKIEHAKRVALGICNPDYAGTDLDVQDKEINAENVLSSGECNLIRQGVFASMNAEPTEQELRKAEARREVYYRFRLQEADGLERSNPRQLQNILMLDHHMAAEYFVIDANWHRAPTAKVDCPNCGTKIPQGAGFHYDNGRICILDWERAWLAGAVKKEDVPEPKRWPGFHGNSLGMGTGPGDGTPRSGGMPDVDDMTKEELQAYAKDNGIEIDLRWSRDTLLAKITEP
jgi:hypothetical protein